MPSETRTAHRSDEIQMRPALTVGILPTFLFWRFGPSEGTRLSLRFSTVLVLFEVRPAALLGKRICRDFETAGNGVSGQGGVIGHPCGFETVGCEGSVPGRDYEWSLTRTDKS